MSFKLLPASRLLGLVEELKHEVEGRVNGGQSGRFEAGDELLPFIRVFDRIDRRI